MEKKKGVSVAEFEPVETYIPWFDTTMDACGEIKEDEFDEAQIKQLSDNSTFLKEWKPFQLGFEQKTVNFSQNSGSEQVNDDFHGINLPPFSSVAVPKTEKVDDDAECLDSDFVLYVGGLVRAMDWCPRNCEKPNGNFKCEYLAIATHPPGTTYNKIGLPLFGRGIIEIWCIPVENVEFSLPKSTFKGSRRRPIEKKITSENEKNGSKRPRGRPRKESITCVNKEFSLPKSTCEGSRKGPRGRPRKESITCVNKDFPVSTVRSGEDSSAHPISSEHGTLSTYVVASPFASKLDGKVGSFAPRRSSRPRKKLLLNDFVCVMDECDAPSSVEYLEQSLPNSKENQVFSQNGGVQNENDELAEDSPSVPTSKEHVALSKTGMVLPVSTNLGEPVVFKRRGRPIKKPIPIVNKCVPTSAIDSLDNSLSSSREHQILNQNAVAGRRQADKAFVMESSKGSKVGAIATKITSTTCLQKPIMKVQGMVISNDKAADLSQSAISESELPIRFMPIGVPSAHTDNEVLMETHSGFRKFGVVYTRKKRRKDKAKDFPCLNGSNPCLLTEHKELAVTSVPSHDEHCEGAIEEVTKKKKLSSIREESALPRVVLCLAHMGKVAWDVKWRPSNVNDLEGKHRLGYLAALLGNGSLEVWEVPHPRMVKRLYTSCHTKGADPRFLKLEPVFRCSKIKCGDRQSIPLTLEWSRSAPYDLILVGCHDGTVALWKFRKQHFSGDTKPLLCFSADTVPIRAIGWAPEESDSECANLIVTAGHEGLKFWDIRDPHRPLCDLNPVQRVILSLDWLQNPGCVILSFDDGTIRILSLWKAANDLPATGKPTATSKQLGLHNYSCSSFAIWSVQVSRFTGLAAYCTADGCVCRFQLTAKAVDKDSGRYREPHFLCGSLAIEDKVYSIKTPLLNDPLPNVPLPTKKPPNESGEASRSLYDYRSDMSKTTLAIVSVPGDDQTPMTKKTTSKARSIEKKLDSSLQLDEAFKSEAAEEGSLWSLPSRDEPEKKIEELPPKEVAIHKVRWNMNRGSERWLCYGGAAGIVRCQAISLKRLK